MNRRLQFAISVVASAVILSGAQYAYSRESLRHADLHAWYVDLNHAKFDGELPDAKVSWGGLDNGRLGSTQGFADGSFEILLDPDAVTTEPQARKVLRHEACHVATWAETEEHGTEWRSCTVKLGADN
jgi:predicted SprT family Zn-dependent metalloprotease